VSGNESFLHYYIVTMKEKMQQLKNFDKNSRIRQGRPKVMNIEARKAKLNKTTVYTFI
jgi:hypothetical protein